MFYHFNKLTQSLVSTTRDVATKWTVSPQAITTTLAETPEIHYEYKAVKIPQTPAVRQVSSQLSQQGGKYPVPNTKGYASLMRMQAKFLVHDGKLVWQKLAMDMPFYYLAVGLVLVGTAMTAYDLMKLASPPKNE